MIAGIIRNPAAIGLIVFCFLLSFCAGVFSLLPLVGLIVIVAGTLIFFFPAYGLMLVIAFFLIQLSPIYQHYGIISRSVTASDLVGAVALAGWIRQELRAGHTPRDFARGSRPDGSASARILVLIAAVIFTLWSIISGLWSPSTAADIVNTDRIIIESAVLFTLIVLMLRTETLARRAAGVYALTALGLALYTIDHFRSLGGFESAAFLGTPLAAQVYRGGLVEVSNYMAIILACAPAFGFYATSGMKGWRRYVLAFAPIPFVILAIAILASRESYVSLTIAIIASVLIAGEFRYRLTAAILLSIPALGIFLALNANSLPYWVTQRFTEADVATFGSRAPFWIVALHLFAQNPLGGLGLGGFEQIIPHYHINPYYGVSATHNQYINALVDSGIFGFVFLIAVIASIGYVLLRGGRHPALLINFLVIVVDMGAGDLLRSHFAWCVLGLVVAGAVARSAQRPAVEPADETAASTSRARAGTIFPVGAPSPSFSPQQQGP